MTDDERDAARWRAVRVGGRVCQTEAEILLFLDSPIFATHRRLVATVSYAGALGDVFADAYADALIEMSAATREFVKDGLL